MCLEICGIDSVGRGLISGILVINRGWFHELQLCSGVPS